jgi:hypothetical protein
VGVVQMDNVKVWLSFGCLEAQFIGMYWIKKDAENRGKNFCGAYNKSLNDVCKAKFLYGVSH